MLRYKLRTLLILLAVGPPVLGLWVWPLFDRIIHPPSEGKIIWLSPIAPPGDMEDLIGVPISVVLEQ
jgi:hypothetical protein